MFRSGRRLFSTAALLMILTAVVHTTAFLANAAKTQASLAPLDETLRAVFWSLAFTMSITFAGLGAMSLVVAASDAPDRLLRALGWVNFVWMGAVIILNIPLNVQPPIVFGVLVEVFVLADLIVKPKARSSV